MLALLGPVLLTCPCLSFAFKGFVFELDDILFPLDLGVDDQLGPLAFLGLAPVVSQLLSNNVIKICPKNVKVRNQLAIDHKRMSNAAPGLALAQVLAGDN